MTHNNVIFCLIAFILGWLISRMMGNGFSVGAKDEVQHRKPSGTCGYLFMQHAWNIENKCCKGDNDTCDTKYDCTSICNSFLPDLYDQCPQWFQDEDRPEHK